MNHECKKILKWKSENFQSHTLPSLMTSSSHKQLFLTIFATSITIMQRNLSYPWILHSFGNRFSKNTFCTWYPIYSIICTRVFIIFTFSNTGHSKLPQYIKDFLNAIWSDILTHLEMVMSDRHLKVAFGYHGWDICGCSVDAFKGTHDKCVYCNFNNQ